jgi:hypothetical protein
MGDAGGHRLAIEEGEALSSGRRRLLPGAQTAGEIEAGEIMAAPEARIRLPERGPNQAGARRQHPGTLAAKGTPRL